MQCKTRISELERDVEYKETERHRACRDYDRLSAYVKQRSGVNTDGAEADGIKAEQVKDKDNSREKAAPESSSAVTVKQEELVKKEKEHAKIVGSFQENMRVLSVKLHQERQKIDSMRRELEKYKALEVAVSCTLAATVRVCVEELTFLLLSVRII